MTFDEMKAAKLTKGELKFCKDLDEKISKMDCHTEEQRNAVIEYAAGFCRKSKYGDVAMSRVCRETYGVPDELEVFSFALNGKECFIVLDRLQGTPPFVIPSGTIVLG